VAVGKDGRLYVVDGGNFRVQIFDAKGGYLQSFGSVGKQMGNFARPKEIAADAEGNVYVVDSAFGNFQVFNPDGELLLFAGERSERDAPGRYMLPSGIAVDEDGRVYVVDQWFRKVDVFRPYHMKPDDGFLGMRPKPSGKR
jgi:DNA-binding beta-propeller fold protein YncE